MAAAEIKRGTEASNFYDDAVRIFWGSTSGAPGWRRDCLVFRHYQFLTTQEAFTGDKSKPR